MTKDGPVDELETPLEAPEAEERGGPAPGVIAELAALPEGAAVFEDALARIFDKHPMSIKRAVQRGELPQPFRMFGKNAWLAGTIVDHWSAMQAEAAAERKKLAATVAQLSP